VIGDAFFSDMEVGRFLFFLIQNGLQTGVNQRLVQSLPRILYSSIVQRKKFGESVRGVGVCVCFISVSKLPNSVEMVNV